MKKMVKLNEEEKRQKIQENTKKEEKTNTENKEKPKKEKINASLEDLKVISYPLITEKAVNMIDTENKITFVVDEKATKPQVKKTAEKLYSIKVNKVNLVRDRKGRKKAIIKLDKANKAQDLATKIGIL